MLSKSKQRELNLWKKWKKSGWTDVDAFDELYMSLQPLAYSVIQKWSGAALPTSAIEAEVKSLMIKAMKDYDPGKGVQMNTFLISRLQKISRFIYKYQNTGTIPEQRAIKIDQFKKIRTFLTDDLNREPTALELAEELKWSPAEVDRMEKELRTSISFSNELTGMSFVNSSRDMEILDLIYYELTPQEKLVYEHLTGKGGKEVLKGQDIAKRLRISPSTVTRLRQSIEKKMNKYRRK
jgi:RNA polymerase sigma factor (sigma-70 family)